MKSLAYLGAFGVVLPMAWLACEGSASACSPDRCAFVDVTEPIASAGGTIARDGVIAMWLLDDFEAPDPASVVVVVTPQGGTDPVAGTLEHDPELDLLVFHPDAPLAPGSYTVHATAPGTTCFGDFDHEYTVEVLDELLPPPAALEPVSSVTWSSSEQFWLDTIVCCDGAAPSADSCGGVWYDSGTCVSAVHHGKISVAVELGAALSDIERANIVVRPSAESPTWVLPVGTTSFDHVRDEPFCLAIEVVHLAQGETITLDEVCFDSPKGEPLGSFDVDPLPELEAICRGEPYVCESEDGWEWDLDQCVPAGGEPEPTDDSGDGGTADGGTSGGDTGVDADGGSGATDGGAAADGGGIADRGCGCRATSRESAAPWLLFAALFGANRRRRRFRS